MALQNPMEGHVITVTKPADGHGYFAFILRHQELTISASVTLEAELTRKEECLLQNGVRQPWDGIRVLVACIAMGLQGQMGCGKPGTPTRAAISRVVVLVV